MLILRINNYHLDPGHKWLHTSPYNTLAVTNQLIKKLKQLDQASFVDDLSEQVMINFVCVVGRSREHIPLTIS